MASLTVRRGLVEAYGLARARRLVRATGLAVSGVSRSAPLTATDSAEAGRHRDDNRRALEIAAELGASHLVMVAGGLPEGSRDLAGARARAGEAVHALLPQARAAGVVLALEAIHPMRAADVCVWNALAQVIDLAEGAGPGCGVVVDAYHVWWDPCLDAAIASAAGQIVSFQFSDWLRCTTAMEADRGMPGDGVVELGKIRSAVRAAGYAGPDELELFSDRTWWRADPDDFIGIAIARYREYLLEG